MSPDAADDPDDPDDPAPSLADRKRSWAATRWVETPLGSPATEELRRTVAAQVTGGDEYVVAARFRAEPHDETLRWHLRRDRLDEYELVRALLGDARVRRVVDPEGSGATTRGPEQLELRRVGAATFQRGLAEVVHSGYVYRPLEPSPDAVGRADRLAARVVHELVLDRGHEVRVFVDDDHQWCHWFSPVGPNATFVLVAPELGEVTLLWVTDED